MDIDHRIGGAPRPGLDQLGEPAADELGSLGPYRRRATRAEPGLFSRLDALADGLRVHPEAGCHHQLRPAGVPMLEYFNNVEPSNCLLAMRSRSLVGCKAFICARSPAGGSLVPTAD